MGKNRRTRVGGRAALMVGVATVALLSGTQGVAHAVTVSHGEFSYGVASLCFEGAAGTNVGVSGCAAGLSVGTFALVVHHGEAASSSCSGIARATLNISSTLVPGAPPAAGFLVVSHGVGTFEGFGVSGTTTSIGKAVLTGSTCKRQDVLGGAQTLTGSFDLEA